MGNIVNPKFFSVEETAKLLNKKTLEVLTLCNSGIIKRMCKDNNIFIYQDSVREYAIRNDIDIDRDKRQTFNKDFTVEEAMSIGSIYKESELHLLVQQGKLKQKMEGGQLKILGSSLAAYLNNKDFQNEKRKGGL